MIVTNDIAVFYEMFYSKVSGRRDFELNRDQKNITTITNFLKKLDELYKLSTLGESFLFDYNAFQFSRKYDRKTRLGKGVIPLNHIVGGKALDDWQKRDEHWKYFADIFCDKFNIKVKQEKNKTLTLKFIEEEERLRFFNTNEGFANCIINDIIYSNKSKYCLICKFKKECIKLLPIQI